ncbi:MAG: caspase family protein [Chlamydiia bacterium]|nr:caspase family protein [Chlamydiia bacterium]
MLNFLARALILLFLAEASRLVAAVHLIIAPALDDPRIARSCHADTERVRSLITHVCDSLAIELRLQVLGYQSFDSQVLERTIDELQVGGDDVVLFYYTGHGYNLTGEQELPTLALHGQHIELQRIQEKLESKRPRLCLIIVDCCNSYLPGELQALISPPRSIGLGSVIRAGVNNNYQHLIQESEGLYVICGASQGEYAFCTDRGGVFTNAFVDVFNSECMAAGSTSWHSIIDDAGVLTQARLSTLHPLTHLEEHEALLQHPFYYYISLRSDLEEAS